MNEEEFDDERSILPNIQSGERVSKRQRINAERDKVAEEMPEEEDGEQQQREQEEVAMLEEAADVPNAEYAREGPLADLRDQLTALKVRLTSPTCNFKRMKAAIRHLLLCGTYVSSYSKIATWADDLRGASNSEQLDEIVASAIQSVISMISGQDIDI